MNLSEYGIYPYRMGLEVRYFIEGIHGNFHIGNTNFIDKEMLPFLKSKGGLMRVINHQEPSSNADQVFSTYGCKEVICHKKEGSALVHPFEEWGVDYYHPQFEILSIENLTLILYFRKKESFLFLDEKIIFNQNEWVTNFNIIGLAGLVEKYKKNISAVFSFNCISGNSFHQVTEGLLANKLKMVESDGP